jgi:hypothetical protein
LISSPAIGEHMSRTIGQQVYLENKVGAGGMIGIETAAKSRPTAIRPGVQRQRRECPHVLRVNTTS